MSRLRMALANFAAAGGDRARRSGIDILIALTVVYFGYHLVQGQRGLLAWIDRSREVQIARHESDRLRAERAGLQERVRQLSPGGANRDAVEEELRRLGYVDPREAIVLPEIPGQP